MRKEDYLMNVDYETEINSDVLSCEDEFNRLPLEDKVVLKEKFSSQHYKLIEVGIETFYLADEFDNYLGCVKLKNGLLVSIHSKLKSGFYNLMFSGILGYASCKEIIVENPSEQALKRFERMNQYSRLIVDIGFEKVSFKSKHNIREAIDKYPRKGLYDEILFENRNPVMDERMFCEPIGSYNCTIEQLESIHYFS